MGKLRGLIIIGAIIALFLALFFFVQFTGFLFDIQQKYADSPQWLIVLYIGGVAVIALVGLILIYNLAKFGSKPTPLPEVKPREIIDDNSFKHKITTLQEKGADTSEIESDWQNLLSIREKEAVSIALFGEINVGKSSLIQQLTNIETEISARGGKTQQITEYPFSYRERRYELIDMPGFNEVIKGDTNLTESLIQQKAIKSHLVLWMLDEEPTESAKKYYQRLIAFNKPIVIAINKSGHYTNQEQQQISKRIHELLGEKITIVWTNTTTTKMVERHFDDGRIESSEVIVSGNVDDLITAIESITFDRLTLDNQLNDSYFQVLEIEMDKSLSEARKIRAEAIVKSYSQKAIFGGMAAVGPGTDVLLQGYLGMGMAKALCELHEVDIKSVDLEGTLSMLNDKMKKELAVILALVGNVCKAFPGIGTVAGGAMHSVAYGLIFESVGRAITACLQKHHGIDRHQLANELEGQIHANLEKRAIRLAKAVIFKR